MEIVGVPFDLCGFRLGSRLGPAAVRLAELSVALESMGFTVVDKGDVTVPHYQEKFHEPGLKHFGSACAMYEDLFNRVTSALNAGRRPIVIGGDHSLSIGSVGAALNHYGSEMALLWVDAHADLNTPDTSPSGNLHGMPLGCLMHEPSEEHSEQWTELQRRFVPKPLKPERTGWLGLRDLDMGERQRLAKFPREYAATMSDIDRQGILAEVRRFDAWLRASGVKHFWMSFDVDVLDPFLAPGTGTAVRGGLTYREMHLLGEVLHELMHGEDCPYTLVGMDIVETNPLFDNFNATAKVAVEFVGSLFGKTILGL
jgi:arginase